MQPHTKIGRHLTYFDSYALHAQTDVGYFQILIFTLQRGTIRFCSQGWLVQMLNIQDVLDTVTSTVIILLWDQIVLIYIYIYIEVFIATWVARCCVFYPMPTPHFNWILKLFLFTSKNESPSTGKSAYHNMLCVWVILKYRAGSEQHQPVRQQQSLNKTNAWCVENRHGGLNTLNISPQAAMTNPHLIVHWTVPQVDATPGPGLSRCDSFPARIPPVYHLNDNGGHLSPRLIISARRTWHLSVAVREIFHWRFSSALRSSPFETLLSLICFSGEGSWSLMNETKGR